MQQDLNIREKLDACEKLLKEVRAYLRSTTPTGKLTESSNLLLEDGAFIIYGEEDLRKAYLAYKGELKQLFETRADIPSVEEFRFTFEDELLDMFYNSQDDSDDDDD